MRVLIDATPIVSSGGSTRHLQNFIEYLDRSNSGNDYFLVANKSIGDLINIPVLKNITLITIDRRSILKYARYLLHDYKNIVRRYDIDLIVSLVNIGFINPPVPQINYQRNPVIFYKGIMEGVGIKDRMRIFLERRFLLMVMKSSRAVITPTTAMTDMINQFTSAKINYITLPHAINFQEMITPAQLRSDIKKRFDNDSFKILYISHFMPHKNHMTLVDAAKILKTRGHIFKIYMNVDQRDWPAGYEMLVNKISSSNLAGYIEMLPRVKASEVMNLYYLSDIFAFPALCESFGFPLMEAMAGKLPVVAAATAVNKEISGPAALYHDPESAKDLADKLELFLKSPGMREEYKAKSYDRFMDFHMDWETYIRNFENILATCVV